MPLVVAIIVAYMLSSVPQVREVYRAMAEDFLAYLPQLVFALPILLMTSVALSLITRELLRAVMPRTENRLLRRVLPLVCAVLPPLGLALGMFFAARETLIGTPPQETLTKLPELAALIRNLSTAANVLYLEAAVFVAVTATLLLPGIGLRAPRVHRIFARHAVRISKVALFGALCMLFFSIFSISGAQLVGPLGVFLLAVIGIVSFGALLTKVGDRIGIPLLSLVILWALALSYFDLTDNHEVTLSPSIHPRLERSVEEFEKWYSAREDRKWYEDRKIPYPVFIVAASGGGLYAAQHAATVLSRMQDRCPNFAQHVFAISGVSGGSLGGAVFSSMAKTMAPNGDHADCNLGMQGEGKFEATADRFMSHDFLSPVLAAALFPDAAQRFLPAWSSRFDRARVFEQGISEAWAQSKTDSDVWSQPFLDHWDPAKSAPALILNFTNVEHGNRVAITPFTIIDWGEVGNIIPLSNLAEFHTLAKIRKGDDSSSDEMRDISLAAAVSLSARFPWIMPAGSFHFQSGSMRMVDGGYVENSGSETAFDLIYALARFYNQDSRLRDGKPPVRFLGIAVTNLQILQHPGGFGLGELLSPIRTMLSTRETRVVVALGNLSRFTELCTTYSECGKRVDLVSFMLNLYDYDLPLGWLLAPSTRDIVRLHSGSVSRAGIYLGGSNIDEKDKFGRLGAYVSDNDGSSCKIAALLDAKDRNCD
ncbi:hypothetical protein IVB43_03620 [Bradyrhizobium sp. 48]|uniref:hypothetical protein n=1 Tax=Bradyrhizobium sp. 48 TaxID=2782676 RepID=UPI001FF8CC16|nr:hypothetical protein [Bradyrhizobium sp. 48]MCK1441490.1 hypothetical protein [Bradyrhizobium sp. 48]